MNDCGNVRPLVMLHVPHGAGTFMCMLARLNSERTCNSACLCDGGDTAYFKVEPNKCNDRLRGMVQNNITFSAIERGVLDDQFCPNQTIFYFRNPMDRIDSLISETVQNVSTLLTALQMQTVLPIFARGLFRAVGMRFFDNFAVRSLVGSQRVYKLPVGSINETHFAIARTNMMQMAFLMTDRFLKTHKAEAEHRFHDPPLCWKNFTQLRDTPDRTSVNSHAVHRLSSFEKNYLAQRWNHWDVKLYELAYHRDIGTFT